jgi:hypothetical protein
VYVILSEAKDLSLASAPKMLRCAQHDNRKGVCHPERSEGSQFGISTKDASLRSA